MKVVEIRRDAELHELKPAWGALLRDSASDTIFLSWEWITAWWSSYGKPGELRLLAAFDDDGELRGIAPLRCQSVRKYGQTVSALSFVGDGSNDSDYLDFIVASGCEKPVMEAFFAHWRKELDRGTVLLFNEIPESSPNLAVLKTLAEPSVLWKETAVPCGAVRLPQSWEDYLSMLRPRFRTQIRSVLRNLESRPEVQFGFCKDPQQIQRMLPVLFDLHARRWAQDGKPGVFGWDRKRDFYLALSSQLIERGWLRFSWLEWNGRVLACQYGFAYRDTYFHLQEGYEPASEHWKVGLGLRAWSVREFLKQGIREYDFLGGVGRHKTDWGAESKQSHSILLAALSYGNMLFCRGPEWENHARESARKILPERLLAARHVRLQQQVLAASAGNGRAAESSPSKWMQKAAAHCYSQFRLPALARPFRDQYRLSISPNGKWPGISLNRRTEPCARILYYHRVNDERDPFFPAISTELFEREMRFIAHHYKVVSLPELLDRLEGDAPEPVLAITFDDGYEDNYQNAFPTLQRYRLPATIFLTTGTMDTREPLWFEQLAQAVKKTQCEFIDLEIDLPRRFWMRTEAQRLESNSRIFGLLRGSADSERRRWLAHILPVLAAPEDGERKDKMLTWDQVRLMKAQGIEFGGHTVTHPFLSRMLSNEVAWEVSECKRRIEEELQTTVKYFAYPNGRDEDIGKWNKELIANAGYEAAMSTNWGLNYRSTDRMELKRGGPWEESPAMFAYKLDWYQWVND